MVWRCAASRRGRLTWYFVYRSLHSRNLPVGSKSCTLALTSCPNISACKRIWKKGIHCIPFHTIRIKNLSYDAAYNIALVPQQIVLQLYTQHHVLAIIKLHVLLADEPKALPFERHCTLPSHEIMDISRGRGRRFYFHVSNVLDSNACLPKQKTIANPNGPSECHSYNGFNRTKSSRERDPKVNINSSNELHWNVLPITKNFSAVNYEHAKDRESQLPHQTFIQK